MLPSLADDDAANPALMDGCDAVSDVDDYGDEDCDEEIGGADGFFMNERASRSKSSRQRDKRTLSDLEGVSSAQLTEHVHALMSKAKSCFSEELRRQYQPEYSAWYARLQAGFSILLHGFGSKKAVLEDFSAHLAELGPVFSLDGHASGSTVRDLLHNIFHALRLPLPAGNSAAQCAHLRRVCLTAAGGKRGCTAVASSLSEVRAEAARPGAHAADGVLRHVLKLLPVHTEAREVGGAFLPDSGDDEDVPCPAPASQAELEDRAAADESVCASGNHAGLRDATADGDSSGPQASGTQPPPDTRPVATQPGQPAGGGLVTTPVKGRCGTPGCTFAKFHAGLCSHVQAQLEGVGTGPPSKRLRRGRAEAALDRIDWDATGGRTTRLPALSAVKVPADMYVVVHGLDAPALRTEASQSVLAALAALPQVHLIGSTSHRNAALLWEAQLVRQLNPLWTEVSTAQPYAAECLDTVHKLLENLHDASASNESQSVETVLKALAPKATDTLCFLIQHHLDQPKSPGLSFIELYDGCRNKDYVSDEAQLHTFLGEYTTHALVRKRRGRGGQESYYCTLSAAKMQQMAEERQKITARVA